LPYFYFWFTGVGTGPTDLAAAGPIIGQNKNFFCSHYANFCECEMNPDPSYSSAVAVFCNLPLILGSRTSHSGVREAHFCDLEVELVFRKISETDATRCQILRLKCTKFDFRWGCATDLAGGVYSAPPDLLAVRPTSKGRDGRKREGDGEGRDREGEGICRKTAFYAPMFYLTY